ncbi:hypothetical protein RclHR1_01090003 [Rhizophagus clarus]|uniref:HMG box domain-containing protein n=1 Tax=Rhizophagus clarus TaxID=94130 RepID=A0A2Z6QHK2_9GLOM|nr:hypothetical protein RclHR1_01090003 [Rhizophagus clarus]GET04277.1 hypothetical protein GLOIN_2v1873388 [Rhizophagus clarus]
MILPVPVLFSANGRYLFGINGSFTDFPIPTVAEVLGSCKEGSKKPPSIFLIFRRPCQSCLAALNFHLERKAISKISSCLWKTVDSDLKNVFVELYTETKIRWRKEHLIIVPTPSKLLGYSHSTKSSDDVITNEQPLDDHRVNQSPDGTGTGTNSSSNLVCVLSQNEEQLLARELFGWSM